MIKCVVCGVEFNITKDRHYISRDEGQYGIKSITGGDESKIYDTFDCPECGCQNVLQQRKRAYVPLVKEDKNSGEE